MNIKNIVEVQELIKRHNEVKGMRLAAAYVQFSQISLSGGGSCSGLNLDDARGDHEIIREIIACIEPHFAKKEAKLQSQLEELGVDFTEEGDSHGEDERAESKESS